MYVVSTCCDSSNIAIFDNYTVQNQIFFAMLRTTATQFKSETVFDVAILFIFRDVD